MGSVLLYDNIDRATQRGIWRYFTAIVDAMAEHFGERLILCTIAPEEYRTLRTVTLPRFRGSRRFGVESTMASLAARFLRPSLYYSAYYGTTVTSVPEVYTVYDMVHEHLARHGSTRDGTTGAFMREKRRCLERATALLTISQSTARDIIAMCPDLDSSRIFVTPLGVDTQVFKPVLDDLLIKCRPYILFVGNRGAHKNFKRLLIAFSNAGIAKDVDLRVMSSPEFTLEERSLIRNLGLHGRVIRLNPGKEADLASAYAGSVGLAYPSEYEGFGLPILEAMACGTLVATSSTSSMPEVGGQAALYFDPCDVESISQTLQTLVNLPTPERFRRVTAGIERSRQFTWSECQRLTLEVLRGVLN